MMKWMNPALLLTLLLAPLAALSAAELSFAGVFTNHAVLQRDVPAPIWGWGEPGEQVTVGFAGQTKTATADAKGKWQVRLDPIPASAVGRELVVQSGSENRKSKISDVLVGEVWLCSGQSNMALLMLHVVGSYPALKERLDKADNPLLRLCSVPFSIPAEPLSDVKCAWQAADPKSANLFSAIGYLFGDRLQRELGVPVGIINASHGGTYIENWTPAEIVEKSPSCGNYMKEFHKALAEFPEAKVRHEKELAEFNLRFPTKLALDAENKARTERGEKPLQAPSEPRGPDHYNRPGSLFNGMIAPLVPYSVKGVLWYQGEGNVWDFTSYDQKISTMLNTWRGLWQKPDMPFFMSELAPLGPHSTTPQDTARCRFGVALAKGAVAAGNAWTITVTDAGEQNDIHPRYKDIPAERFAALALAKVYGKPGVSHGPVLKSWKADDGKAILTFDSAGKGLEAKTITLDGHKLTAEMLLGFEVADKNQRFFRAKAEVSGPDTVVVSSPEVPEPVAVRYAWADFPLCNLFNREGFATYPFRTDDWPWKTPP